MSCVPSTITAKLSACRILPQMLRTTLWQNISRISFCTWWLVMSTFRSSHCCSSGMSAALSFSNCVKLPSPWPRTASPCRTRYCKDVNITDRHSLPCCWDANLWELSCWSTGLVFWSSCCTANLWLWLFWWSLNFSIPFFQLVKPSTVNAVSRFLARLDRLEASALPYWFY